LTLIAVPFTISVASSVSCGENLLFRKTVTDSQKSYIIDFSLNASVPMQRWATWRVCLLATWRPFLVRANWP
jgi:hypothetical protein